MSSSPPPETRQELVLTTHALGAQSDALAEVSAERTRRHDECLASWATEYGPLNRVLTLWDGCSDRRTDDEPGGGLDWLDRGRLTYALDERRAVRTDLLKAPLLELRMYATKPGRCETFISALTAALPYRERYSPCVAVWTTRERGWDLAVHLWAYDGFESRITARRSAAADPRWAAYRNAIPSLLEFMQAFLLTPVPLP